MGLLEALSSKNLTKKLLTGVVILLGLIVVAVVIVQATQKVVSPSNQTGNLSPSPTVVTQTNNLYLANQVPRSGQENVSVDQRVSLSLCSREGKISKDAISAIYLNSAQITYTVTTSYGQCIGIIFNADQEQILPPNSEVEIRVEALDNQGDTFEGSYSFSTGAVPEPVQEEETEEN